MMTETLIGPETGQLELPIKELVIPARQEHQTIQQAFEAFHAANPWVYTAFERLTADWIARGRTRIGIGMLTEVIRWQYGRQTESTDGFKINNNFRSRYVRFLIHKHPGWADAFETRELKAP
jgi:hypothetical protein